MQKNEKENLVERSFMANAQSLLPRKHEVDQKPSGIEQNKDDDEENSKKLDLEKGAANKEQQVNRQRLTSANNLHSDPLVTVSWRIPHKKRGEQQPGFNLDYAPPKTHPPVHN